MDSPIQDVTGVLIAGGKSRRMGQDKRFLKVAGVTMFDRTLSLLRAMFAETFVVLAEPIEGLELHGCPVRYDVVKNAGSLGGLLTGLLAATRPRIFAVACDMPFLDQNVIRFISSRDPTADVVVAHLEGRFHPMQAVYSTRCIPLLHTMAERRELKIQTLFDREELQVTVLREEDFLRFPSGRRSFENLNTPSDLASVERAQSDSQ